MSLRSAPEWLWSAPERSGATQSTVYLSLGVSDENDVLDDTLLLAHDVVPEWLSKQFIHR